MNLLTGCKTKVIQVENYCTIASTIKASDGDKKALKDSEISKEFIEKIVNHNDTWEMTCAGNE